MRVRRPPRTGTTANWLLRIFASSPNRCILCFVLLAAAILYVQQSSESGHEKGSTKRARRNSNKRLRVDASDGTGSSASNPQSLLNLHPDAFSNLPSCSATRQSLTDTGRGAKALKNRKRPTILSNWEPPALSLWSDRTKFTARYGSHPQYVKRGDVQPLQDGDGKQCTASTATLTNIMEERFANDKGNTSREMKDDLLFFTNDYENPTFIDAIKSDYDIPQPLKNHPAWSRDKAGFKVFSAMEQGSSHPFHLHDAAWLGQVAGSRLWFLLPPGTNSNVVGPKVNGCDYLLGKADIPKGAQACVQEAGEVMYLPPKWVHATCALESWSVGVGGQGGSPAVYQQGFETPVVPSGRTKEEERKKLVECGAIDASAAAVESANELIKATAAAVADTMKADKDWKWFDGNLGEYYDKLEHDEHAKRKPNVITSYAVHRWMGPKHSTLEHYNLIRSAIYETVLGELPSQSPSTNTTPLRVFDAGCGLGAGLMWFEQNEPNWAMVGHTISDEQFKWISEDLPEHQFTAKLHTYDEPLTGGEAKFDAVYSIEAAIHSPDLSTSIQAWSDALEPGGVIVLIDDFLSVGTSRDDPDVDLFARSWIANSVHSTKEIANFATKSNMKIVRDRDIGSEYEVIKLNYRNKAPELKDELGRAHQGWLGSKVRQRLTVQGKITYRMVVLRKNGEGTKMNTAASPSRSLPVTVRTAGGYQPQSNCPAVPSVADTSTKSMEIEIDSVLMTGQGKNGGQKQECLSSWYCCDKGLEYWEDLEANRNTRKTGYLQLSRDLFGNYLTSFAKHLTNFYRTYPSNYSEGGKFLDIGGTGSVASGMTQVTSKFAHFAGPLKYWVLDSDPAAKKLSNAIVCDIDDCPIANDCEYDVTFSFTVLEHAVRPWQAFDTIARITKKGGLTLHLVPWSYQYHATPDDNYRFSHKALTSLLEDRGFEVLDVGYDICKKPVEKLKVKDEHFDPIWLTYVVGRKL